MPPLHPRARRRSPININSKSIMSAAGRAAPLITLPVVCVFVGKHTSNSGSYSAPTFSFQQSTWSVSSFTVDAATNLP